MMFITPIPPSASVTMPTMVKNCFMCPIMRPNISVCSDVSHIAIACCVGRVETVAARQNGADVPLERPVDVLDPAGALVERARQQIDDPVLRRDDDVRQRAGLRVPPRHVARHRRERHEDLVVVGSAVVAVLVLLADLADHRVRHAVQRDRFAEDVPLAEQLLGHVEADDRDARHLLLRPASAKLRPYSSSMVRMS